MYPGRIIINGTKELRRNIRKGLFARARVSVNGGTADIVTTKNSVQYWIMYKLNRAAKKRKMSGFLENLFERGGEELPQETMRAELTEIVARVAKANKEAVDQFIFEHCTSDSKISSDRVLKVIKDRVEVTVDLSSYIKVGLAVLGHYIDHVKSRAVAFIKEYGKTQEHQLSHEEINKLLHDKITEVKEHWKVLAFME